MDFTIYPSVGVGELRFGMTCEEVRRVMPPPHRSFLKDLRDKMPTDAFADTIHVFYDDSGRCDAVEFYPPSRVLLNGKNLVGIPYSEAKHHVLALDPELKEDAEDNAGFTSYGVGVGAYTPCCREYPDEPTKSIIVFKPGYYDKIVGSKN